jgi:hypothetical protein
MVEYYKTNKGYCYKKTKKYGSIRISLEDYKKAVSKNGGVVKRKLNNAKNSNVTSRSSTGQVTVRNTNNNRSNNRSNKINNTDKIIKKYSGLNINKEDKPRKSSFEYDNNGSKNFYYSKTNEERQQRREELTNVLKKEEFKNKTSQSDMNEINSIVDKILKEENNAKKLFENPKLTKKNVWEFQMNLDGTFNNLESRKQMKKILNQTERNRRKEIINAPRSSEEEKRRKKIVANILSNKNKGKGLPQNLANKIANMSREQPPPPTPPPPPPRTHAEIQANNNQLDNAFWDAI